MDDTGKGIREGMVAHRERKRRYMPEKRDGIRRTEPLQMQHGRETTIQCRESPINICKALRTDGMVAMYLVRLLRNDTIGTFIRTRRIIVKEWWVKCFDHEVRLESVKWWY